MGLCKKCWVGAKVYNPFKAYGPDFIGAECEQCGVVMDFLPIELYLQPMNPNFRQQLLRGKLRLPQIPQAELLLTR